MKTIIRKWRVQPVRQGMKAPYSFVYTKDVKVWYAEKNAMTQVEYTHWLSKIGWDIILTLED